MELIGCTSCGDKENVHWQEHPVIPYGYYCDSCFDERELLLEEQGYEREW